MWKQIFNGGCTGEIVARLWKWTYAGGWEEEGWAREVSVIDNLLMCLIFWSRSVCALSKSVAFDRKRVILLLRVLNSSYSRRAIHSHCRVSVAEPRRMFFLVVCLWMEIPVIEVGADKRVLSSSFSFVRFVIFAWAPLPCMSEQRALHMLQQKISRIWTNFGRHLSAISGSSRLLIEFKGNPRKMFSIPMIRRSFSIFSPNSCNRWSRSSWGRLDVVCNKSDGDEGRFCKNALDLLK